MADGPATRIASGTYLEGLAIDGDTGAIWYSDVVAGGIHGVTPDGAPITGFDGDRMWTGGVLANGDGAILSTGQGGIRWTDPATGRAGWLLDEIDGHPVNGINEMTPDGAGGLFFGTSDLERVIAGESTRPTAIYQLTVDRRLVLAADGIGFTNGMAFDPARRRLYCNDTFRGTWAFDVSADLSLSNRRLLLEKADADGMALDANGNIWITGFASDHIARITPDGAVLPNLPMPAGAITQIRFAGSEMRDLYVNTVPVDGGAALKKGRAMTEAASHLLRLRAPVAGMTVEPPRFALG